MGQLTEDASSPFRLARDRDATATIRGFVYQVDTTLLRWLNLGPGERLELERGEDIDLVQEILSGDESLPDRVFEAIKLREARLTLRSGEALEALANFCEHRQANPGISLRFRYITNCEIGLEKAAVDMTGAAGVQIWENVRLSKYGREQAEQAIVALRNYLLKAHKPLKLNQRTWEGFGAFLANATTQQFRDFVMRYEWSARNPSASDMRDVVMGSIRSRRGGDQLNERLYYEHLFAVVFRLLSQRVAKVLDVEGLVQAFAGVRPDIESEAIIARIQRIEEYFASRLDRIEGALSDQGPKLDLIVSTMMALSRRGIESPEFAPEPALFLEVPPSEIALCARRDVVNNLATLLESKVWLALSGGIGSGKTQLTILIARRFAGTKVWLRLRGLTSQEAAQRLDAAMRTLSEDMSQRLSLKALYSSGCGAVAADSLIVLDDLHTTGRDTLSERLIILAQACAGSGVRLLTTSADALPQSLESHFESLRQTVTPPFSPAEVRDFLSGQECPADALTDAHVHAIHLFSHGHPVLLSAIGRVLRGNRWRFDTAVFHDLVGGKLGSDLNASVQDWLLETVSNDLARNLLYRIRLIGAPFSDREVTVIARVQPEIPAPIEKLRQLAGLWVQHDAQSIYIASPLVQRLNESNLTGQTTGGVHLSLAREVMRKRKLGPFDVVQAFIHFAAADHLNEAAFVLLIALQGIAIAPGEVSEDFGLTAIWAQEDLPEVIDLGTRILLRASQVVIRIRRGEDASYLLQDLDRLADIAEGGDRIAVLGASGLVAIWLGKSQPLRATQYVFRGLETLRTIHVPDDLFTSIGVRGSYLFMLWWAALSIDRPSELVAWLNSLRLLTPSERHELFTLENANKASEAIITSIWLPDNEHPAAERDWAQLISEIDEIAAAARDLGSRGLYLHAQRGIILIRSQLQNDVADAVRLAQNVLFAGGGEPNGEFLIAEITARQLYFTGDVSTSLPWWDRALAARSEAELEPLVSALTVSGVAYSSSDSDRALADLRDATRLTVGLPRSAWMTSVRAGGELAILLWHQKDFRASYEAWANATRVLIANKDDSLDWKIQFRIFGNCSNYFGRGFRSDDSDWNYIVPASGILLRRPIAVASSYQAAQEWLLPAAVAMFAWGLGVYDEAAEWARQATEVADTLSQGDRLFRGFRATLFIYELPALLGDHTPARLIDSLVKLQPGAPPWEDIPVEMEGVERELEIVARLSRMSADVAMFAVGLAVVSRALDDLGSAVAYANQIVERASEITDTASDFWTSCSQALSDISRFDDDWASLYEAGKLLAMSNRALLGALYYFGAMRPAMATTALRLQLAVLQSGEITFDRMLAPYNKIYSLVVPAFIVRFWIKAVEAQPFRFGHIRFVRQELVAISQNDSPNVAEMKAVIRVIAGSLGLNLAKEDHEWLQAAGGC